MEDSTPIDTVSIATEAKGKSIAENPSEIIEIQMIDSVAMVQIKPLSEKKYDSLVLEDVFQAVSKFGIQGKYLRVNGKLYDTTLIPALNAKVIAIDIVTGNKADPFPRLEEVFSAIQTFGYNGGILRVANIYANTSYFAIYSQDTPNNESSQMEQPKI